MQFKGQYHPVRSVAEDAGPSATALLPKPSVANAALDKDLDVSTPVLLLGGGGNSAAATRDFARHGIAVRLSAPATAWGVFSRYRTKSYIVPNGQDPQDYWRDLLLGPESGELFGHIIIALCDEAIEFLSKNHKALSRNHLVEDMNPRLRQLMLDKQATLEQGRKAGVAVPNFWNINTLKDLQQVRREAVFPVMVKPIHSHLFVQEFGRKLFIIENSLDEVEEKVRLSFERGLEVMVCEMVPGPDTLLSSYYTYIDRDRRNLFHYTKSIIRRFPVNRGGACYHQSEWLPETAACGQKFFASMPWRGMANIEFKRDLRDGQLKVIEVNPRFTDAHRLMIEAGMPLGMMVYRSLTKQPVPRIDSYDQNLRFWNPLRDFMAFLEMRRSGDLTFMGWLKSITIGRKVLAMFSLSDPAPTLIRLGQEIRRAIQKKG